MQAKKIRYIYLVLLLIGFIFLVTGFSFSLNILDYLLIGLICIYPIIKFFQIKLGIWIKATVVISGSVLLFFLGQTLFFMAAFGENKQRVIQSWKAGKYKVELASWQGWAGPPYNRCEIKKLALAGVLEQKIAEQSYLTEDCIINVEGDGWNENKNYQINTCNHSVKRFR